MAGAGTRFVVKRLNWSEHYRGTTRQPGEVALASFDTFDAADADRAAREAERRTSLNPFECGNAIQYWTHFDEPRLRDWLMDHGIDPPGANKDAATWAAWWKADHKKLGAEKRAVVWEVLDKVRFFAVREEPACVVGYAVLAINWEYNDENYTADAEGGRLFKVYRTRARAEAACAAQNEEAREAWGFADADFAQYADDIDDMMAAFDMQDRLRRQRGLTGDQTLKKGEGLYNRSAQVPFFEVVEVPLEGLE